MSATQGYGCMGLSAFYSSSRKISEQESMDVIYHAIGKGVTLFNTATFYGPLNINGYGANLRLIRKCLVGIDRSKIQIMCKIGMDTKADVAATGSRWFISGTEEHLRADIDYALQELGVDCIDIVVLCRIPTDVPIEDIVATLQNFVTEGKCKYIGLSEANANTLRKACAVAPIYCIEQEYSMWTRDIEADIIPTCRELGIKIIAYSPLGRGFLTGSIRSREDPNLDAYDYRLIGQPRLSAENIDVNLKLVDTVKEIADKYRITQGQLALAWLHSKGPDIIPIPGTSSIKHLDENLAARDITLAAEDISIIDRVFTEDSVIGDRYAHMGLCFNVQDSGAVEQH